MVEIRWTVQAAADLQAITDFIAADSRQYARLFAMDVFSAVERLHAFPYLGRVVPELRQPDTREIVLGNDRIVYRVQGTVLVILTVWHGARLFDPARLPSAGNEKRGMADSD